MKVYRVHNRRSGKESDGFTYVTKKDEAAKLQRKSNQENGTDDELEELDISLNKTGILEALKQWAAHPDNG